MRLSAIIIAKNEEDNIERCIVSLRFADEIVVVDAESNDATVRKARQLGARVFVRRWEGYGSQKNFGASQARGQWLLFVDADEEIPPTLAKEIKSAITSPSTPSILHPQKSFYWLRIITIFLGKPLRHLTGHNPRLFKKDAGRWTGSLVHEQVQTNSGDLIRLGDGRSAVLAAPLLHYSHRTITAYRQRMHAYTTLDAQQMAATGRHRSGMPVRAHALLPLQLALKQFLKMYFYKKGFLDGYAGLMWCLLSAYYEWEMAAKFLPLAKNFEIRSTKH